MGRFEILGKFEHDDEDDACRCGGCVRRRDERHCAQRTPAVQQCRCQPTSSAGGRGAHAPGSALSGRSDSSPPPFDSHLESSAAQVLAAGLGASKVCAWGGRVRVNFPGGPTIRAWPVTGGDGVQRWRGEAEHYMRPLVYSFPHACDTVVECVRENALSFMGHGPPGMWVAPWLEGRQ